MNHKLIAELAEKCTHRSVEYVDGLGNVAYTHFDRERFVELIVEECVDQIVPIYMKTPLEVCCVHMEAVEKIREHFYVEN